MKKTLCLLGIGVIAVAQLARADDASSKAATGTTTSATHTIKALWPDSKSPAHRTQSSGVPNFGKLNDFIWRSGQPTKEGYQTLVTGGLKTVVNLRGEFPQDKELVPQGVRYMYIPIRDDHEPTDEQAKQFVEIARNPDNWPILVHCKGGEGRAGVMSAIVRYSLDGWKNDMIMKEVGSFKTRHMGFITTPMADCQQKFIRHWEDTTGRVTPFDAKAEKASGK